MKVADYSMKPSDFFMMLAIIAAFLFCLIESHSGSNARQDTILITLAQSGRSVLIAEGAWKSISYVYESGFWCAYKK